MRIPVQAAAAVKIAAKESARYALNSVNLTQAGELCRIDATCGRRLIRMEWKDANAADLAALVNAEEFGKAVKAVQGKARRGSTPPVKFERGDNGTATVAGAGARVDLKCDTESGFPPVADCIPTSQKIINRKVKNHVNAAVSCFVNPKLLAELLLAMPTSEEHKGVRIMVPLVRNRPIRIDSRDMDGVKAVAVIMPVNESDEFFDEKDGD